MKLTLEHISDGQDEIIIRYRERNERIDSLIRSIEQRSEKILAVANDRKLFIFPSDVLYLESVDNAVFAYCENVVGKTNLTLSVAEELFACEGFFRCSKSMIINIYHISYLQSISGNRADVTMDNGEHVIISRRYVRALRSILKGENR